MKAAEYLWVCRRQALFVFAIPEGLWPSDRITTPSSAMVMVPSSSLSNSMNASLNSAKQSGCVLILGTEDEQI
jgi:hypothetical protein